MLMQTAGVQKIGQKEENFLYFSYGKELTLINNVVKIELIIINDGKNSEALNESQAKTS